MWITRSSKKKIYIVVIAERLSFRKVKVKKREKKIGIGLLIVISIILIKADSPKYSILENFGWKKSPIMHIFEFLNTIMVINFLFVFQYNFEDIFFDFAKGWIKNWYSSIEQLSNQLNSVPTLESTSSPYHKWKGKCKDYH